MNLSRKWILAGAVVLVLFAAQAAMASDAFHSVLIEGPETKITRPMLIVGLEKASPREAGKIATDLDANHPCVDPTRCLKLANGVDAAHRASAALIVARMHDDPLFVSHIVELRPEQAVNTLYSAYESTGSSGKLKLKSGALVDRSWSALESDLSAAINERLDQACQVKCPTHIVLMSTGWRTTQQQSIANYQLWSGGIEDELKSKNASVAPMFIGLTWPSVWTWFELGSFQNKAHDADEAGYIWGALLLHRVLDPIAEKRDLQIVLVGHSFGARLLTGAIAGRPLVTDADCLPTGARTLMIGYQGAFSTGRFAGLGLEGGPYTNFAGCRTRYAYTASIHDEGVRWAPMEAVSQETGYIGGKLGLQRVEDSPAVYEVVKADSHGGLAHLWSNAPPDKVLIIDGSDGVSCHNDVYDQFAARLAANLIVGDGAGRPDLPDQHEICKGRK